MLFVNGETWPRCTTAIRSAGTQRLRALAHDLHCRQSLSIRQAQRIMLERHGVRRSPGADPQAPDLVGVPEVRRMTARVCRVGVCRQAAKDYLQG